MSAAIVVVWWVALLVALALTGLAVLQIVRIVEHAREIKALAERTVPAAQRIARHTAAVDQLGGLAAPVGRLVQASTAVERTTASLRRHVSGGAGALERWGEPSP